MPVAAISIHEAITNHFLTAASRGFNDSAFKIKAVPAKVYSATSR